MIPLPRPSLAPEELPWVESVVRAAFGQRRKTLANALRGSNLEPRPDAEQVSRACARAGVAPRARAESLEPEQLLALARALARGG